MSRIEVEGLRRTHPGRPPVQALRGIDLEVAEGEIVAVLGPSGCGKTTLLRIIAGLDRADAGRVRIGGRDADGPDVHLAPRHRSVGLLPQEGALFPHLDVAANVAFGLHHLARADRRRRVDEMLELTGLADLRRRRPQQLSGGQRQRVALARALAPRPGAVLLDEPFSALDAGLRSSLRDEVTALLRQAGTTALIVTHDQVEAMAAADRIAVMRDGRFAQVGTPEDVYRRPSDRWTGTFVGEAIVVPGRRTGPSTATGPLGTVSVASPERGQVRNGQVTGTDLDLFVRPEQIRRTRPDDPDGATARVRSMQFRGPDLHVVVDLDGATVATRWPSIDALTVDDVVRVRVDGDVVAFEREPLSDAGSPAGDLP